MLSHSAPKLPPQNSSLPAKDPRDFSFERASTSRVVESADSQHFSLLSSQDVVSAISRDPPPYDPAWRVENIQYADTQPPQEPPILGLQDLSRSISSAPAIELNSRASGPNEEPVMSSAETKLKSQARKARREARRISLAPDQPPTTQGKPRERVYVACVQCRNRKIRCDGAKPACHNCSRRTVGESDCSYDSTPKRRGPDRNPGARQRVNRDISEESTGTLQPVRRRRRRREDDISASSPTQRQVSGETLSDRANPVSAPTPVSIAVPIAEVYKAQSHTQGFRELRPTHCELPNFQCNERDFLVGQQLTGESSSQTRSLDKSFMPVTQTEIYHPGHFTSTHTGYLTEIREDIGEEDYELTSEPSLDFTRKTWWDSLLSLYISSPSGDLASLTSSQRDFAAQNIMSDLRFLFRCSNFWFSFFHIPSFFSTYSNPQRREQIQPSLILAALAVSTFFRSSEIENGQYGRDRAMRFRDEAQSALEASFNARWIDESLVQAAWLLALFEVFPHPLYSSQRCSSSMIMMDSIIRSLSLTLLDVDDPNTSVFHPRSVPSVPREQHKDSLSTTNLYGLSHSSTACSPYQTSSQVETDPPAGCLCKSLSLGANWALTMEHAPLWAQVPAWNSGWSEAEIRKESCRRVCWSAMILAAGHASYTIAHKGLPLNLFIGDPANYALLFSGESFTRLGNHPSKDTVWALHDRAFLLWLICVKMRDDPIATDREKAQFAGMAWLEADALEEALNKHTCGLERAFIYQGREYLFNTRMCVSNEFQRYVPLVSADVSGLFHRRKAEEWLSHQANVAQRLLAAFHTITGNPTNVLARRPFFIYWFMGQVSRALSLWACDNTLTIALHVCKAFLPAIDYLTALWPCPEQRIRYSRLLERLHRACFIAGQPAPPPPNLALPTLTTP